jgi:hypothetical protein
MAPGSDSAPFESFWMGGYEGADHLDASGRPLDMVRASGHLDRLEQDHAAAAALGLRTVRESIGWRLAEPAPGRFDFDRALAVARSARAHGLQVLWTLMHHGTPADVSLFDDALVDRFAEFAAAAAAVLKPMHERPPVYTLATGIGFLSWAVSATNQLHPYQGDPMRRGESTEPSGYAVKCRLVRAVLAAIAAVKAVDPRARFLHVEPVIHVAAPPGRADLVPMAEQIRSYQWQVWDLLAGRREPQLGGHAAALDLIGVSHYHGGQWEVVTERRLAWPGDDPRRCPLASLLAEVWRRYRRPLIVAETGHVGSGRAPWLDDVAAEALRARGEGVPLQGICLYPLVDHPVDHPIDHPDGADARRWHRGGLWDVEPARRFSRRLCAAYAATLAHWQQRLPEPGAVALQAGPISPPAAAPQRRAEARER